MEPFFLVISFVLEYLFLLYNIKGLRYSEGKKIHWIILKNIKAKKYDFPIQLDNLLTFGHNISFNISWIIRLV